MKNSDIQIRGVPPEVKTALKNVAKNRGETMSSILKHHIHELLESLPEHMKRARVD